MKEFHGFENVRPLDGMRLAVKFLDDPETYTVDLAGIVGDDPLWSPLRDPDFFAGVRLVAADTGLEWSEELDMAGDVIWRAVAAERGEIMPEGAFRAWRQQHSLTLDQAAAALGISRRLVAYYDSGQRPVPRTIMLATRGYEAMKSTEPAGARTVPA